MPILDILQSISVIIVCATAIYGINSWRRELKGRKEMEIAEQALALFYESRDIIRAIRSPLVFVGEGKTRRGNPNETEEEKEILDRVYVVVERYDKEKVTFAKLRSLKYRFMAVFGAESGKPFDDLTQTIKEIFIAANMLGTHYWHRQGRVQMNEEQRNTHLREMHEAEGKFWAGYQQPDVLAERVDKIISDVENICSRAFGHRKKIDKELQ